VRRVYVALCVILLVAVAVQFYFAAVGAFTTPRTDSSYWLHAVDGVMVIPMLSLLATIAAALARAPGRLIVLAIAPLGLVVVQMLIVAAGQGLSDGDTTTPAALVVYGLHAINGLAIMHLAGMNARASRRFALTPPRPALSDEAGASA
jgi:hypothetical protein